MDIFRVIAATALFCTSSYLIYDLFVNGFDLMVLPFSLGGYVAVQ
jgi:hypothetical protein